MNDRRPLATPEELAAYLQVPMNTVYNWRRRRTGPPGRRIGKHIRYAWADIEAWVMAQPVAAA